MKILATALPYAGHLLPMVGVASELEKRGHQVTFIATAGSAPELERRGFKTVVSKAHYVELDRRVRGRKPLRTQISDPEFLEKAIDFEVSVIRSENPSVFLVDSYLSVPVSCTLTGLPWIPLFQGDAWLSKENLVFARGETSSEAEGVASVLTHYRLGDQLRAEVPGVLYSPHLNLITGIPFWTTSRRSPCFQGPVLFLGMLRQPLDSSTQADFPLVRSRRLGPKGLVSFGTLCPSEERYRLVLQAASHVGLSVTCNTGLVDPSSLIKEFPEATVARHLPEGQYLSCLEEADLLVFHGGFNTLMLAMYYGKKCVVLPCNFLGSDQVANGQEVKELGFGVSLEPEATEMDVRAAMSRVLGSENYAISARAACKQIRALTSNLDWCKRLEDLSR